MTFMIMGRPTMDPVVASVQENSPAAEAGFLPGDIIRSIDGTPIASFTEVPRIVAPNPGQPLEFVLERGGSTIVIVATPRLEKRTDRFGNSQDIGFIGLVNDPQASNYRVERLGPLSAVGAAAGETWFIISRTLGYIGGIFAGTQSADQLGGPVRVAQVSGEGGTLWVAALIKLAAGLLVSIGLLNLFPIPMLDGGHLVFYAIEALRGRPLGEKAQEFGFRLGLAIVLMLMVFATWNDITQLVFNDS